MLIKNVCKMIFTLHSVKMQNVEVILLLYHCDISLTSEGSKKCWSVKECANELKPEEKKPLLLIHAFSGCD